VKVQVTLVDGQIEFVITDNGVGIEQSLKSKSGTDSHISKGMQITGNRIALLRKMSGQVIHLEGPYQLHGTSGEVLGTEVKISVPVNFNELFSN
jgi:nitrate/nitrite-specific signal transduction histidine kinase